ncbi:MAG: ATP/GTP-binding protein [Candidatus Odinarchaeota archaeon]|nr:ATP/GTP-binding protein [Candidatus Odinarchaeota archaeon]
MYFIYVLGPAGCGKSTLTATLNSWIREKGMHSITLNLDPGAYKLPYYPEINIRDYIKVENVIEKYNLGPNGALILASDLIVNHIDDIISELEEFDADYVFIDTPGQLELFAFRSIGPLIIKELSSIEGSSTVLLFLIDSNMCRDPSSFISMLLLSTSTHYRLSKPQVNVLSKIDLLNEEEMRKIVAWTESVNELCNLIDERYVGLKRELTVRILNILKDFEDVSKPIPVSSFSGFGLNNLYAAVQRILAGGEDYRTLD